MKTSTIFENLNLSFGNGNFDYDEFAERRSDKAQARNKTRSHQAVRGEKYFVPAMDLEIA